MKKTIWFIFVLFMSTSMVLSQYTVSIHREYMWYRTSGSEWETDVIADFRLNGVPVDNVSDYYFEWRHVFGPNDDRPGTSNGMGIDDVGVDEHPGTFYDVYLKIHNGDLKAPVITISNTLINVGRPDESLIITIDQVNEAGTTINQHHIWEWVPRSPHPFVPGELGLFKGGNINLTHKTTPVSSDLPTLFLADTQLVSNTKMFNNWQSHNTIINHKAFYFDEINDLLIAQFKNIFNSEIILSSNIASNDDCLLQFKNPWLRDDNSSPIGPRNRGTAAIWHPVDPGQYQVFLEHDPNSSPVYYSLRATPLHTQADGRYTVFTGWQTAGATLLPHPDDQDESTLKAVVFNQAGATVEAQFCRDVAVNGGSIRWEDNSFRVSAPKWVVDQTAIWQFNRWTTPNSDRVTISNPASRTAAGLTFHADGAVVEAEYINTLTYPEMMDNTVRLDQHTTIPAGAG